MDRSKWEYKKLGDISVFLTGCRPKGGVAQIKEGVHSLGGEHIGKDGYVDLSSPKFVPESFFINNKGHIKDNDILLCKDGALSGKVAIVRGELNDTKAMVNEHVFIIRSDSLLHKYLFYYLFSPTGQYQLKLRISGAAQGGINGANLSTIIVPYPKDVSLQQRIVAELDCLNEMIALKQEQLKEFDKLAQSIFYDMFGDPAINDKKWDVFKLGELCTKISDGVHAKPTYVDKGMPFISVVNINKGCLTFENCKYVSEEEGVVINKRSKPERGDVLYTKVGATYGIPALVDTDIDFCLYVSVCLIKPKHEIIDSVFLTRLMGLPYIKHQADERIKGIGVPDLHLNQISAFNIPLPPLALQQQFAEKIQAIEAQKELVKKSIAETQHLLDSRMDYYFD